MVPSVADIIRGPKFIDISKKVKIRKMQWVWTPPGNGQIKVNIDGSFLRGLG